MTKRSYSELKLSSVFSALSLPRLSTRKLQGLVTLGAVLLLIVVLSRLAPDLLTWERWKSTGLVGVFVLSIVSSGGLALPVPALLAVFLAGQSQHPALVAVVAAIGMTLGELTGYALGAGGRLALTREQTDPPSRLAAWSQRMRRLVARNGFWGLALLAFIPNPLFDLAGAVAGAAGMSIWRFLLAVGVGRLAKTMLVAYAGALALGALAAG